MDRNLFVLSMLVMLSALNSQFSNLLAQGSLTPPGAPAPTMKTLAQIEPRTPISSLPFTITAAGAYYLTTNLTGVSGTNGITIAANDVTLDLMGFSLVAVPGAVDGILVSGSRTNLWLGNGTVREWGLDGIDALNSQSSRFTDLTIIGSGNTGLRPGPTSFVTRCTSFGNAQEGFLVFDHCYVNQCAARNNGAAGISAGNNCRITDCLAQFNNSDGIAAGAGCSITGCISANHTNNNTSGISTGLGCSINHCSVANNYNGILAGADTSISLCTALANIYIGISIQGANCIARACVASSNAGNGIVLYGRYATVEGCTASGNLYSGITVDADGCLALNNTCDSNGAGISGNGGISLFSSISGRIEGNRFSNNSHNGLFVDPGSTHNLITRNMAVTNSVQTTSYNVNPANNDLGPIGRAATATSPWANLQY